MFEKFIKNQTQRKQQNGSRFSPHICNKLQKAQQESG
jgi:hypothetical protein